MTGPPSVEERRWSALAAELPFDQAAAARRQAESWRNLLTGLTALLAAAGLVAGRDDLRALTPAWRIVAGATLTLGLAAFVLATFCAGAAAYGFLPRRNTPNTGRALRAWSREQVDRAGVLLRRAMVLSLAGVVLVAAAAWTTWTAPEEPAGTGHAVLVRLPEGPVCGELLALQDGRVLLSVGGTVRTVPLAGGTALEPRERC